jgi:hypothetical protein
MSATKTIRPTRLVVNPIVGDVPANLVHPAAWKGHATLVGCSGSIKNRRGVTREFAPILSNENIFQR